MRKHLSRTIRYPLRLVKPTRSMKVVTGPNRGMTWIAGSSIHSCWLGTYERRKAARFAAAIDAGDVVFDLGAHAGYYTLIASRKVSQTGHVFAVEPAPQNLDALRRHLQVNAVENVTVIAAALGDVIGTTCLSEGAASSMWRRDEEGQLSVRAETLDHLCSTAAAPPPNVIKMDVEGSELAVLKGGMRFLEQHRPTIFLATHGAVVHAGCQQVLMDLNYEIEEFERDPARERWELIARGRG